MKISGIDFSQVWGSFLFYALVSFWLFYIFFFPIELYPLYVAHFLISLSALYAIGFNAAHPLTFYTLIYIFYFLGYPVVVELGMLADWGVTQEVTVLHTLAYIGFAMPLILIKPHSYRLLERGLKRDSELAIKLGMLVLFLLGVVYIFAVLVTGSVKGAEDKVFFAKSAFPFNFAAVGGAILLSYSLWQKDQFPKLFWLAVTSYLGVLILISGQRSIFVKFVIASIIISELYKRRLRFSRLVMLILVGFFAFGMLKQVSNVISNQELSFDMESKLTAGVMGYFFYKEFKTSGRITAAAIKRYEGKSSYGYTYVDRASEVLLPGYFRESRDDTPNAILTRVINPKGSNVGLGFSVVAEGYINGGWFGVFLNMFIMGCVLSLLYLYAFKSPVWMAIYAMAIASACIHVRHSTLSVYATVLKSVLVPVLLYSLARLLLFSKTSLGVYMTKHSKPITIGEG